MNEDIVLVLKAARAIVRGRKSTNTEKIAAGRLIKDIHRQLDLPSESDEPAAGPTAKLSDLRVVS